MSEKERKVCDALKTLPADVQDHFLDQITGAAIALEHLAKADGRTDTEQSKRA